MGAKVPMTIRLALTLQMALLPPFASSPSTMHSCWRTGLPPRMAVCLLILKMASSTCSPVELGEASVPWLMKVPRWPFMHREQLPNPYDVPGPLWTFNVQISTRMSMTPLTRSAGAEILLVAAAMVTGTMPPSDWAYLLTVARILVASVKLA